MDPLEISINDTVDNSEELCFLIKEFEHQQGSNIDVRILEWSVAWTEFMKISIYRHGPVISETGDTWMGSLVSRNCLRSFTQVEIDSIGGAGAFLGEMWHSCIDPNEKVIAAIPWSLDTYMVYYRRDMLARAGVDESTAFNTIDSFTEAIEGLHRAGIEIPISLPTGGKSNTLIHNAASWIWERGGDYISADGKEMTLTKPETLAGLKDYFNLYRFIPPSAQHLNDKACANAFTDGNAAITLQNPTFLNRLKIGDWTQKSMENIGIAVQPGVPFLGGSHLIIWNHIRPAQEKIAVGLIRYLTSTSSLKWQFERTGLIPARLEALKEVEADPLYAPLVLALKTGRAYRSTRLWGLVEERLVDSLENIWNRLFSDPDPDLEQIIKSNVSGPEARLNLTLSQ